MMDHLKIRVPATSANLGSGFDVFGIALETPFDIIDIIKSDRIEIVVLGRESQFVPTDPKKNTKRSLIGWSKRLPISSSLLMSSMSLKHSRS